MSVIVSPSEEGGRERERVGPRDLAPHWPPSLPFWTLAEEGGVILEARVEAAEAGGLTGPPCSLSSLWETV